MAALVAAGDRMLSILGFAATIIFTVRHIAEQSLSATGLARILYAGSAMPAEIGLRLVNFLFLTQLVGLASGGVATGLYAIALPKLGLGKAGCRIIAAISFAAAAHRCRLDRRPRVPRSDAKRIRNSGDPFCVAVFHGCESAVARRLPRRNHPVHWHSLTFKWSRLTRPSMRSWRCAARLI